MAAACQGRPDPNFAEAEPGEPLPGLDPVQLDAFERGRALFNRPFTEATGLGPRFNQDRCGSCHDLPTSGGHGAEPVLKFSRYDPEHGCSTLPEHGGDLQQARITERARAAGLAIEAVPPAATAVADTRAPPLYGLGLVARIAEADILARADPDDLDGDGISGRPNLDADGRVGRFGHKAQHATLEGFSAEALLLEMGITNPAHPAELAEVGDQLGELRPAPRELDASTADLNPALDDPGRTEIDPAPDPEVDHAFVDLLVKYIDLLAPPKRLLPADADARADIDEGERIFAFMGCDACHVPTHALGPDAPDGWGGLRFRLYSDLLLHDMGPELAGTCTPGTTPSEWKTARLVGLGHRSEFLHNGRAQRIEAAIELHGGEGAASRAVFRRLTQEARRQVLAFLRSL